MCSSVAHRIGVKWHTRAASVPRLVSVVTRPTCTRAHHSSRSRISVNLGENVAEPGVLLGSPRATARATERTPREEERSDPMIGR